MADVGRLFVALAKEEEEERAPTAARVQPLVPRSSRSQSIFGEAAAGRGRKRIEDAGGMSLRMTVQMDWLHHASYSRFHPDNLNKPRPARTGQGRPCKPRHEIDKTLHKAWGHTCCEKFGPVEVAAFRLQKRPPHLLPLISSCAMCDSSQTTTASRRTWPPKWARTGERPWSLSGSLPSVFRFLRNELARAVL